jgi:DNA-binding transcriptional MerR regulator
MRSYSIGEISKMFNLPISTLRYYDKEGLFPDLQRYGDRRLFTDYEIEALHVIECLKASGLGIKEIKHFMQWCEDGPSTYNLRMQLFEDRKKQSRKKSSSSRSMSAAARQSLSPSTVVAA